MQKLFFLFNSTFTQLFNGKLTLVFIAILSIYGQICAQSGDTTPPKINDFSFSSQVIDTTDEAQNVTVNLRVSDNNKGVNFIAVRFRSSLENQFVSAFINKRQLISGDNKNGVYSASVTFPQYSKAGMWNVSEIEARDGANNYKTVNAAEIASLGFANELQVISNNEDISAPEITNLKFNSLAVDTTNGSQTVNVFVRATDAFSGVRNINVYLYQPSNDYLIGAELNSQQLISGDGKDGVYSGTIIFPQGTDSGMWRVNVAVNDAIGNYKTFNTDELAGRGFATELLVIGQTQTSQPAPKSRPRLGLF